MNLLELKNESLQNDFLPLSSFLCSFFHIPGVDFSGNIPGRASLKLKFRVSLKSAQFTVFIINS